MKIVYSAHERSVIPRSIDFCCDRMAVAWANQVLVFATPFGDLRVYKDDGPGIIINTELKPFIQAYMQAEFCPFCGEKIQTIQIMLTDGING